MINLVKVWDSQYLGLGHAWLVLQPTPTQAPTYQQCGISCMCNVASFQTFLFNLMRNNLPSPKTISDKRPSTLIGQLWQARLPRVVGLKWPIWVKSQSDVYSTFGIHGVEMRSHSNSSAISISIRSSSVCLISSQCVLQGRHTYGRDYLSSFKPLQNMSQWRLTRESTHTWSLYNHVLNHCMATTGGMS